jgi:hypothetical protein
MIMQSDRSIWFALVLVTTSLAGGAAQAHDPRSISPAIGPLIVVPDTSSVTSTATRNVTNAARDATSGITDNVTSSTVNIVAATPAQIAAAERRVVRAQQAVERANIAIEAANERLARINRASWNGGQGLSRDERAMLARFDGSYSAYALSVQGDISNTLGPRADRALAELDAARAELAPMR